MKTTTTEDHYDAVAEAVVHTASPDNPLKADAIAEVAGSIAEQVIPYNCQETANANTGTTADTRCNLPLSLDQPLDQPLELRIDAPFRESMGTTNPDVFGRTTPVIQDSNPIISEIGSPSKHPSAYEWRREQTKKSLAEKRPTEKHPEEEKPGGARLMPDQK